MARERLVEVYRASSELEALIIKGLLETSGIRCILTSHAAHSVHAFTTDGMGEVRIMVLESHAKEADEIVGGDVDVGNV